MAFSSNHYGLFLKQEFLGICGKSPRHTKGLVWDKDCSQPLILVYTHLSRSIRLSFYCHKIIVCDYKIFGTVERSANEYSQLYRQAFANQQKSFQRQISRETSVIGTLPIVTHTIEACVVACTCPHRVKEGLNGVVAFTVNG